MHKRNNDWSFEESAIIEETIAFVKKPLGESPILEIGRHLAKITEVKFLIIDQTILPAADKIKTRCFLNYGKALPNITYSLKDTPCQDTFDYGICYYPVGVKEIFPKDKDLVEMDITSYMGTVLNDQKGNNIGLIVLLHDKTIQNPGFIEHLLTIVSVLLEQHLAAQPSQVMQ